MHWGEVLPRKAFPLLQITLDSSKSFHAHAPHNTCEGRGVYFSTCCTWEAVQWRGARPAGLHPNTTASFLWLGQAISPLCASVSSLVKWGDDDNACFTASVWGTKWGIGCEAWAIASRTEQVHVKGSYYYYSPSVFIFIFKIGNLIYWLGDTFKWFKHPKGIWGSTERSPLPGIQPPSLPRR